MVEPRTRPRPGNPSEFLSTIEDPLKRGECRELLTQMRRRTKLKARLWGPSVVGFGSYHYRYASGREGDWMVTGFAPRKRNLVVYTMPGFSEYRDLMAKLGRHKTGKSCLYISTLDDIDRECLWELINRGVADMMQRYPCTA